MVEMLGPLSMYAFLAALVIMLVIYAYASFAPGLRAGQRTRVLICATLPFWIPMLLSYWHRLLVHQRNPDKPLIIEVFFWVIFSALFVSTNSVSYERAERGLTRLVTRNSALLKKRAIGPLLRLRLWHSGIGKHRDGEHPNA